MQKYPEVGLGPGDRKRLEAVVADRNMRTVRTGGSSRITSAIPQRSVVATMIRAPYTLRGLLTLAAPVIEAVVDVLLRDKMHKPEQARSETSVVARLTRTLGRPRVSNVKFDPLGPH